MYNGKLKSYKYILERLYTDYPFNYSFQNAEAIEWLDDALRDLGINRYYVDKVTDGNQTLGHKDPIIIKDHRGDLPCDLLGIVQTAYLQEGLQNNTQCSPLYMGGLVYYDYHNNTACTTATGPQCGPCMTLLDWPSCATDSSNCHQYKCHGEDKFHYLIPMRYTTSTMYQATGLNHRPSAIHCTNLDAKCRGELTYEVNNNQIVTNFREGRLVMAYRAIPTDDQGYPMIPDDHHVLQFVIASIATKIAFKLYWTDKVNENKFALVANTRDVAFKKAIGKTQLDNKDYFESYKNARIRSFKSPMDQHTFFAYLGTTPKMYQQPSIQQLSNFN
jgi:hypothetical protein